MTTNPDPNSIGGTPIEVRPGRELAVARHDTGADTTLFFIHGGGGNKNQWRNQWRHFQSFNLLAWDALGHGKSPQPRDEAAYDSRELIADARALFARHRSARNILVAHSMGARLALSWALADRSGIDAIVLIGAAPLGPMAGSRRALFGPVLGRLPLPLLELFRPILSEAFRKRAWHKDADSALVHYEQNATKNNKLYVMQALFAGAGSPDPSGLSGLEFPIAVIAGDSDGLVPPAASQALADRLPQAGLHVLANTGHQIMLERPDETNQIIAGILARVEPHHAA